MIEDLNKSVKFFEPQRRRDAENTIESSLRLRASAVKSGALDPEESHGVP
jgi:hypothetical protein